MIRSLSILSLCLIASCTIRAEETEIGLDSYTLQGDPIEIQSIHDDASGVTFSGKTKTLFVIENGTPSIRELTTAGKELRSIDLPGFEDGEDLVWIEGDTFGIIEERRRMLAIVHIRPGDTSIPYSTAARTLLVEPVPYKNVGLEGVTYNTATDSILIVKEKQPRRIYELKNWRADRDTAKTSAPWDAEQNGLQLQDMAGICLDPSSGHLLVLSDESRCIVECTTNGQAVARLHLTAGSAGLTEDIPQPEGIAMDTHGNLYICSEPNLLYILQKK